MRRPSRTYSHRMTDIWGGVRLLDEPEFDRLIDACCLLILPTCDREKFLATMNDPRRSRELLQAWGCERWGRRATLGEVVRCDRVLELVSGETGGVSLELGPPDLSIAASRLFQDVDVGIAKCISSLETIWIFKLHGDEEWIYVARHEHSKKLRR